MTISCPACNAEIAVDDINVAQGMALCRGCQQLSPLQELVKPSAASTPTTRFPKPEGTKIELAEIGDRLVVAMPRGQNRALGFFLLLFGGFWDLISGIILVSILASGSHGGHGVEPDGAGMQGIDWFGLIFVSGFFLIGLLVLAGALYVLTVRIALSIDRTSVTLVRSAFGREWTSERPTASATAVRRVVRYTQNNVPKYGVGIEFTGDSSLSIGSALSDPELDWLSGEIAHALRQAGATIA